MKINKNEHETQKCIERKGKTGRDHPIVQTRGRSGYSELVDSLAGRRGDVNKCSNIHFYFLFIRKIDIYKVASTYKLQLTQI